MPCGEVAANCFGILQPAVPIRRDFILRFDAKCSDVVIFRDFRVRHQATVGKIPANGANEDPRDSADRGAEPEGFGKKP